MTDAQFMRFFPLLMIQGAQKICTVVIGHVKKMGTVRRKSPENRQVYSEARELLKLIKNQ